MQPKVKVTEVVGTEATHKIALHHDILTEDELSRIVWRNCLHVSDLPRDYDFFALVTSNKEWHDQSHFMKDKRTEEKEIAL
jgi:hypothetical protein